MDVRQVPQLLGDFLEVEARALRERDQDDLVKGRFAVAALAPARLAFGRDQAELLVVTQRRRRHGGALGHLADVDQLIGEMSERTTVPASSLRYYEKLGLI